MSSLFNSTARNDELPIFEFADLQLAGRFLTLGAPVQAEGTLAGNHFYFRARHEAWEFVLSESPGIHPLDVPTDALRFFREGTFGSRPSDASYMPPDTATAIIRACAEQYFQSRNA
jgi:hypothetical protein